MSSASTPPTTARYACPARQSGTNTAEIVWAAQPSPGMCLDYGQARERDDLLALARDDLGEQRRQREGDRRVPHAHRPQLLALPDEGLERAGGDDGGA